MQELCWARAVTKKMKYELTRLIWIDTVSTDKSLLRLTEMSNLIGSLVQANKHLTAGTLMRNREFQFLQIFLE